MPQFTTKNVSVRLFRQIFSLHLHLEGRNESEYSAYSSICTCLFPKYHNKYLRIFSTDRSKGQGHSKGQFVEEEISISLSDFFFHLLFYILYKKSSLISNIFFEFCREVSSKKVSSKTNVFLGSFISYPVFSSIDMGGRRNMCVCTFCIYTNISVASIQHSVPTHYLCKDIDWRALLLRFFFQLLFN